MALPGGDQVEEIEAELADYFHERGQKCLKITPHSDNPHTFEFICIIETSTGQKQRVFVRIARAHSTLPHHPQNNCVQ